MTSHGANALRQKILGVLLRSSRTEADLTLADCAGALGVSTQKMSEYEHGRQGISLPEVEILARLLRRPLSYFLNPPPRIEEPPEESSLGDWIASRDVRIGQQIQQARQEAYLSQKSLATGLGISVTRLSAYERGKRPIPLAELEIIADTLGLSVSHLASRGDDTRSVYSLAHLPDQLAAFVVEPASIPYLRMAVSLSQLSSEEIRLIAEVFASVHAPPSGSSAAEDQG